MAPDGRTHLDGPGLMGRLLQLLISLNRPINRINPSKEHRHRWQQLLLEQRDLLLPIGVIDPWLPDTSRV